MIKEMNTIHKQHLYFGKEPYRPLRRPYRGPNGCVTDPHIELCPHWVFDLLHRIPKVPKWTDISRFSHVVSFYWPSFGLFAPSPYCDSDYAQGPYMDLNPKLFSLMDILATFWQFWPFWALSMTLVCLFR